jgi:elongation factor 1-beta
LSVFDALGKAPAAQYANIARWYRHISSFSTQERNAWTGSAVPQVSGGTTTTAAADDDDVDLFGSDEEDDEEAERIKEERVKAYAEKKSKKPALIAKSSILLDCKVSTREKNIDSTPKFNR